MRFRRILSHEMIGISKQTVSANAEDRLITNTNRRIIT